MPMEIVARDPEPIFSDLAEADESEDEASNRRPQKQLPWRGLGNGLFALRHLGRTSFANGRPRMRAKRLLNR
jgi:hypothetical protein